MTPARPVLLIRPDGNERDAEALVCRGLSATIDPWLRMSTVTDAGLAERMLRILTDPPGHTALVVTSPRTWRHLAALVGAERLTTASESAARHKVAVFCTGAATRASLPSQLADHAMVAPTAGALADVMAGWLTEAAQVSTGEQPPTALLPGSVIGRQELPVALRQAGWRVVTAPVYTTERVAERPPTATPLCAGAFCAVLLRSPSAVAALRHFTAGQTIHATTRIITVGPTTTEAARSAGWRPVSCPRPDAADVAARVAEVVEHETGGQEAAAHHRRSGRDIRDSRQAPVEPADNPLPTDHPSRREALAASAFLAACRGVRPERSPVWFMRQAGRSLPEYRAARQGISMLDSCLRPELAAELTLQPVRRYGVDAAIFYSDIMVPLKLAGVDVDIVPGVGPVLGHPIRDRTGIAALPGLADQALQPIREGVGAAVAQLGPVPLIGFAGGPYTVASYLIEGGPDRAHRRTRTLLAEDPDTFRALVDWVAEVDIAFLRAQVLAGASAVQLFDSWVGELDPASYLTMVQPASARVLLAVRRLGVPVIHFGTGTARLLVAMRDAGADVMGVGADISLQEANQLLGGTTPLQGNIDPQLLSAPMAELDAHLAAVLDSGAQAPAHIVNLAHGVPANTDPAVLAHVVEFVHAHPGYQSKGH